MLGAPPHLPEGCHHLTKDLVFPHGPQQAAVGALQRIVTVEENVSVSRFSSDPLDHSHPRSRRVKGNHDLPLPRPHFAVSTGIEQNLLPRLQRWEHASARDSKAPKPSQKKPRKMAPIARLNSSTPMGFTRNFHHGS